MTDSLLLVILVWQVFLTIGMGYVIYLCKQALSPCFGDIIQKVVNDPQVKLQQQNYVRFTEDMVKALNANTKALDEQEKALKEMLEKK